jgi:hypothetical protein
MKKKQQNTRFVMSEAAADDDEIIATAITNNIARNNDFRYHSITSLAAYKNPYNEYLVEISGSLACSRDYLYWFKLAVLGNI